MYVHIYTYMPFNVSLVNNKLVRRGRPKFINATEKNIVVNQGEDRRHILHGATQISDVLTGSFNRIIEKQGASVLEGLIDGFLSKFRERGINFKAVNGLAKKAEKVITIAFSLERNLVAGSAIHNQGIEKARESIHSIRKALDKHCLLELRQFDDVKIKALQLVTGSLDSTSNGVVARHRVEILNALKDALQSASDVATLIRILADFEFSCTLDIVHSTTTKEQNIWGITMVNRLQEAIRNQDDEAIFAVLL